MNIQTLAQVVDDMIVQHDYPGFEPRSLRLGLPDEIGNASSKVFSEALGHESVYVRLAALRWFQDRAGMGKGYVNAITGLLRDEDPWVRMEAIHTLEKMRVQTENGLTTISSLLSDSDVEVRKAAAKALGKLGKEDKARKRADGKVQIDWPKVSDVIVHALKSASLDGDKDVRAKAQKALRLLGVYGD